MSTAKSLTTALLIAGAVTAPVASAGPATDPISVVPKPAQVQQPTAPDSSSFDWGDAGIGAGGAVAVALLSLAGVAGVRRGRHGRVSPAS
jgi:hypothetical protein